MLMPAPFLYSIKRSARATQVRIIVKAGKVEVVAPERGVTDKRIQQFVQTKQAWIEQALAKLAKASEGQGNPIPDELTAGAEILYRGQHYALSIQPTKLKKAKIELGSALMAYIPEQVPDEQRNEILRKALLRWLKQQTLLYVQEAVRQHADKRQLFPRTITIKSQKSRWGSCGIHGDIHINWLLILAPPKVLEYVVVHELCHLLVRNHSRQFWDVVADHLPDYAAQRRWLKTQGRHLMMFYD